MAYRNLEVTLISATDLEQVPWFPKMQVYVVVSLSGDPWSRQRTPTYWEGHRNPAWNSTLRFNVPADNNGRQVLHILLRAESALGDHNVSQVQVPLSAILDATPGDGPEFVSYQVFSCTSGTPKGVLNLCFKVGRIAAPTPAPPSPYPHPLWVPTYGQPMMAHSPLVAQAYPPPAGYPYYQPRPPPYQAGNGYPPAGNMVHMVTAGLLCGASHAIGAAISQMAFNGATGF
ncbi:putative protein SRC2 [Cocos nucifera]|uniref:C2 domain-containing protein n=1 Tax=Cocos nucifera TaxID=13894 RepID=A0A8K0IYV2_COCNU|nr:putative protein SRC2 [Cocos nucifera]